MTPVTLFRKRLGEVFAFLAFSEPRIDRTALSRFALFDLRSRPTTLPPCKARASCAHAVRGTGNLRAAGASGARRTRGRPARLSRDAATRAGNEWRPRDRRARRLAVPPPRAASVVAGGGARGRKTSARPKWLPRSGPILALLGFSARSRRASRQKTSQGETVSDPRFLFLGSIRHGSRQIRLSRQARFSNGHLVEFCLLLYSEIAPGVLDQ